MEMLQVGKPNKSLAGLGEGISFRVSDNEIRLLMTYNNIHDNEVKGVRFGDIEIGLGEIDSMGMIFISIEEALAISDMPLLIDEDFSFTDLNEDEGYALTIILAEEKTGVIKALRAIGLGHEFSLELRKVCEKLGPVDVEDIVKGLLVLQSQYSSEELKDKIETINYKLKGTLNAK